MYFSIVVPLYNKKKHIARTLYSILNQKYTNFEVIVVNDGSDDGSEEIVKKITDPRLRLINQPNKGPSAARNLGVQKAISDFVCLLDADDVWLPNFLEIISELLRSNPEKCIFCLRHKIIDLDGSTLLPKTNLQSGYCGVVRNFIQLYRHSTGLINASSVCLRKDYFLSIGGFPENEDSGEDIYLWLIYALESEIVFCDQIGSTYHRDSDNRSIDRITPHKLPYYFVYFLPLLNDPKFIQRYPSKTRKDLKKFLRWRAILHISELKYLRRWKVAYFHSIRLMRLDYISGFFGVFITLTPIDIIKVGKYFRNKRRATS